MIRPFKPVKGNVLPAHYGVFDCETEGLHGEARLICLITNTGMRKTFIGDRCAEEFIEFVTQREFRSYSFYAHNLAFDLSKTFEKVYGNLIDSKSFDIVISGTRLIKAVYMQSDKNRITFLDSLNLLPLPLAAIGDDLGFPKLHTPDKWMSGEPILYIDDQDIEYCFRDCEIIIRLLEVYRDFLNPFRVKIKLTFAANAKAIWRSMYCKTSGVFVDDKKDERFRQSYYGGRVEVMIRRYEYNKKLYYYDINSMYPFCMMHNKFPNPDKLKYSRDISIINTNEGCAELTVKSPDMKYPLLPYRHNGKLTFPIGEFKGTWNFPEIRKALDVGYEILEVHWILSSLPMESPFTEYVELFRDKKIQYKKDGKDALSQLSKWMLNSLYGKFAQRKDAEERYVSEQPAIGTPFRLEGENSYKIMNVERVRAEETAVCWSSYVTTYARLLLYSFFPEKGIYYMDTDSIVMDSPLPDDVIDDYEFGKMSLEDEIEYSIFVAPKRYAYRSMLKNLGNNVKKIKAIPKDVVSLIPLDAFNNDLCLEYSKPTKMKTALHKGIISYSKEPVSKNLKVLNPKRIFYISGESIPIHI